MSRLFASNSTSKSKQTGFMSFSFNVPLFPSNANTNTETTNTQPETSEQEQTREETSTNVNNDKNTEQNSSSTAPIPPSFTFGASDPPETGTPIFGGFSGATFSSTSGGNSLFGANTTPTFGSSVFASETKPITFGTPNTPSFGQTSTHSTFKFGGAQQKETNASVFGGGGFSFGGPPLVTSAQSFNEAMTAQTAMKKLVMPPAIIPEPSTDKKEKLFEFNVPLIQPKPTKTSTNGKAFGNLLTIFRNSNTIR
jgi:hypothetical protein